jgi:hypothetical protein
MLHPSSRHSRACLQQTCPMRRMRASSRDPGAADVAMICSAQSLGRPYPVFWARQRSEIGASKTQRVVELREEPGELPLPTVSKIDDMKANFGSQSALMPPEPSVLQNFRRLTVLLVPSSTGARLSRGNLKFTAHPQRIMTLTVFRTSSRSFRCRPSSDPDAMSALTKCVLERMVSFVLSVPCAAPTTTLQGSSWARGSKEIVDFVNVLLS